MIKAIKIIKNTEIIMLNQMIFMLRRKMFLKNMLTKDQVKVNVLTGTDFSETEVVFSKTSFSTIFSSIRSSC